MIESIMYFGGGFLVASLLAIILISFVHQRAVRLTQRRLADAIPVSMAEIQADKDHLRAEFALSQRRLEMAVDQLKAKTTAQLGELVRKNEAIGLLKAELLEKTAVTDELAAKARALGGKITLTEQENLEKVTALEATSNTLAAKDAEIAHAASIIAALNHAADTQRVEVAVLRTQVEDLKSQVGDMQHATDSTAQRLLSEQSTSAGVYKDLAQARQTIEMLHPQVARLEHELAARAQQIEDRDAYIAEQTRLVRQAEADAAELRHELAIARQEAVGSAERLRGAKSAIETQLQTANDVLSERASRIQELERRAADSDRLIRQRDAEAQALTREIATLKDEIGTAHAGWADEKTAFKAQLFAGSQAVADRTGRITDFERRIGDFERLLGQRDADATSLQEEIAVLREEATAATAQWNGHKVTLDGRLAAAHDMLAERAARIEALEHQAAEFGQQIGQRDDEAHALRREIASLEDEAAAAGQRWLADKTRFDAELASLSGMSAERAFRIEGLEHQLAATGSGAGSSNEQLQLLQQREAELAALKREAETLKAEQSENALVRERISDIAAQIANMTMSLDKSGSPIPAILAETANGNGAGETANGSGAGGAGGAATPRPGNLVDRIRALRTRASRISTAS
jgi:chromosome segregation ATPase